MNMKYSAMIFLLGFVSCRNDKANDTQDVYSQDLDLDGFSTPEDCNDADSLINPGMTELCDAIDNNCDGNVDEGVALSFYADQDQDGFGDPATEMQSCEQPLGYVTVSNDCDDSDPEVYSGATEICNERDDNCDGEVDEDLFSGLFYDADGDGHGDPNQLSGDCSSSEGYVYYGDDCDDTNPNIFPFAIEVCNEIDDNCDGDVDEAVTETFYLDIDGDGFGNLAQPTEACALPEGHSLNSDDCDDFDPLQYPTAGEYCNQEDDDCDGETDEDPLDSPTWYYDIDGDGYGSNYIVAFECQAPVGYVGDNTDCDDTNTAVYPTAIEVCDDLDNDCNGAIDDNAVDALYWYHDSDRDDYGDASDQIYLCDQTFGYILNSDDCDDDNADIYPGAAEYCNGVDEDCDGNLDNNPLDSNEFFLDSDGDGFGDPQSNIEQCDMPTGYVVNSEDCNDSDVLIHPDAEEDCDGIDQNCNGNTFYELDLDGDGKLGCERSVWVRNASNNPTNPNGNLSQAANYLTNAGLSINQRNLGNLTITSSYLQDFGVYVHHGRNTIGSLGAYSNAEAFALSEWVYGGGRYLFIDYHNAEYPCEVGDSLPAAFGITCSAAYASWSGSTSTFEPHPITAGLTSIGGSGGQNWGVVAPTQALATISGNEMVIVAEYGEGKMVLVANEYPFRNPQSGYSISFDDNEILVENIWDWLLE